MGGNNAEIVSVDEVRGAITRLIDSIDAAEAQSIAEELISRDGFSETLVNGYPRAINLGIQIARAMVESLEQLPADRSAEMLAEAIEGVNGKELGETINALSRLLIAVHDARPGLMAESRVGVVADTVGVVDFGKLRKALTAHYQSRMAVLEGKVDYVVGSPLALANLLNVLPSLINDLLRILGKALTHMKFPDELLANALFTLLQDIDMNELGQVVNATAELVIALSHGDLIMGIGAEPYLKEVLSNMGSELAGAVDGPRLKEVALALGSYGKVIGGMLSEYIFESDQHVLAFNNAILVAVNALVRTVAEFVDKLGDLPDDAVARMSEGLEDNFQAEELGRALNALAVLLKRMSQENPDLVAEIIKRLLSSIEPQQMAAASKVILLQVKDAAFADPNLGKSLAPAAIGQAINESLASFNRLSREKPVLMASGLTQAFAAVDTAELGLAVDGLVRPVVEAALQNGQKVRAVLKPVIWGVLRYVAGSIKNARVFRRFERQAQGGSAWKTSGS